MTDVVTKPESRLADATILALIPFVGYALAFVYEAGFVSRYHIPFWFIQVSLTQVYAATVLLAALSWFAVSHLAAARPNQRWKLIPKVVGFGIVVACYISFVIEAWRFERANFALGQAVFFSVLALIALQAVAGIGLQWFVRPLQIHSGPLLDRLVADDPERIEAMQGSALALAIHRGERAGYPAFAILTAWQYVIVLIAMAGAYGRLAAAIQQEFVVRISAPECVVLRSYGGNMLCVAFDSTRRTAGPQFWILPATETAGVAYEIERVGRMDVSEPSAPEDKAR